MTVNNNIVTNKRLCDLNLFKHFLLHYNFITFNYWNLIKTFHITKIFWISIDLTSTWTKIPNIIFFVYKMFYWIFALTSTLIFISLLIWIIYFNINLHLQLHEICFVNVFASFIYVIILNTFKVTPSVLLGTRILADRSSRVLQFLIHLSKLLQTNLLKCICNCDTFFVVQKNNPCIFTKHLITFAISIPYQ